MKNGSPLEVIWLWKVKLETNNAAIYLFFAAENIFQLLNIINNWKQWQDSDPEWINSWITEIKQGESIIYVK